LAFHDLPAPNSQDQGGREGRAEYGKNLEKFVGDGNFTVVVDDLGEVAGPSGEVVRFQGRGFQRFNTLDARDPEAFELTGIGRRF
jgi:hypothetical protein